MNSFIEELKWRGLLHDMIPKLESQLNNEMTLGYIGFDPTADSLHIGNLIPIILLRHFQNHGHKPIVLVGGSTGLIGDPSGKSAERNLLDVELLKYNIDKIKIQLQTFLNFDQNKENSAILVNNYDWMKNLSFLEFSRDIGKHITVNYMMAKESVKKRISGEAQEGMSFTEFTYQLLQGYDFYYLFKEMNVKLQMGGSDQWGNLTTGTELIRRKLSKEAYALTCPLVTKPDGTKFGKSESGENVWLDPKKTSVFKFYQFWLNVSDDEAQIYLKKYTFLNQDEIQDLYRLHQNEPHSRLMQKKLAELVTSWVHSSEQTQKAKEASQILFGNFNKQQLETIDSEIFSEIFEGVPQKSLPISKLEEGIPMIDLLSTESGFIPSKSAAKRLLDENSISVNKQKTGEEYILTKNDLISNSLVLLQKGKKSYFILKFNR